MNGISALSAMSMSLAFGSRYQRVVRTALYRNKDPKYVGQRSRFRVGAWSGDSVEPTFTKRSFKVTPDSPLQMTDQLSRQQLKYKLRQERKRISKEES